MKKQLGFAAQLAVLLWITSTKLLAQCLIHDSQGKVVTGLKDPLALLLNAQAECPTNVFELKQLILEQGAKIEPTMVNNKGFHSPQAGSYTLFESVSGPFKLMGDPIEKGDFFFGHFTVAAGRTLIADILPRRRNFGLLVELIVFSPKKDFYNFYELQGRNLGTLENPRYQYAWFYQGDSKSILIAAQKLHRKREPNEPVIAGQRSGTLRCASCHVSGGPILKEFKAPHNDWWTVARGLSFGKRVMGPNLKPYFDGSGTPLVDVSEFAKQVGLGIDKLEKSRTYQAALKKLGLQVQLRPLFCTDEINLESDKLPRSAKTDDLIIPSGFFVDTRLAEKEIKIRKSDYTKELKETLGARFLTNSDFDGDHAWLTPVKGVSDLKAVKTLIEDGTISEEFVYDVLAVDPTRPLFSTGRCELLKLVPEVATKGWEKEFEAELEKSPSPAAKVLLANLTQKELTKEKHQADAAEFLNRCEARLKENAFDPELKRNFLAKLLRFLGTKRLAVRASEISKGEGGEILEPGFRAIFPVIPEAPTPGLFKLSPNCEIVAAR